MRTFEYSWMCNACNEKVHGEKELGEHQQDYSMEQVANLVMVTLPPACENCGSMNVGTLYYLREKKEGKE